MTFSTLRLTIDGPVATIALARPDKLNAIDSAMHADNAERSTGARTTRAIRVVVLTGEETFSSGQDLRSIYCRLRRALSSALPSSGTTIR